MPLLICLIYKVPMRFSHQWVSQHLCINSNPLCCCFDAGNAHGCFQEKRKRVLELDVDLKVLNEREMKMRRLVEESPNVFNGKR